ncbi:MAG: hypothetical protein ABJA81_01065 [Nocardioidaceae bacterium]
MTKPRRSSSTSSRETTIKLVDPFDLPDWLGTKPVTWHATSPLQESAHVSGEMAWSDERQPVDLLAVDAAYPAPVCPESVRRTAHQSWQFGQVALVDVDGGVAAAVPGTGFDANLVCEAIRRIAKAVGAPEGNYTVLIAL